MTYKTIYNIDLLYIVVYSLVMQLLTYVCFLLFYFSISILFFVLFLCFTVYTYLWIKMQTHTEILKIVMGIMNTEFVIMICCNYSEETKGKIHARSGGVV